MTGKNRVKKSISYAIYKPSKVMRMDKEARKQSQAIINERIKEFLAKSGERSQRQFAYRTGINEMTLSDALRGTEPKFSTLEAILKAYPKLSAEWLMRGEGEMYRDGAQSPQVSVVSENRTGNGDIVSHTTAIKGDDSALVELLRTQLAQKDEQIRQLLNVLNK